MQKTIPLYDLGYKAFTDEPVVKVSCKNNEIKIAYLFPGFTISDGKRNIAKEWKLFKEVHISGTGFLSVDKEPLLPSFGRFVQIPPFQDVADIKSKRYNRVEVKEVLITWAEETVEEKGGVEFNETIYKINKFMPKRENMMEHSGPFYMDGYKVILIHVRPLQYNPQKNLLRGYGKIIVTIKLLPLNKSDNEKVNEEALTSVINNLEGFSGLLLNPDSSWSEVQSTMRSPRDSIPSKPEESEFLIIYDRAFSNPAEKLAKWKNVRGLTTTAICTEKIWKGRDDKKIKVDKLKAYLRQKRSLSDSRLRYVLLFGDVDQIPSDERSDSTTDYYYFTHQDAENEACLLPWISGGRIPVEKMEDAMSVVDQIIRYEKAPPPDSAYYKRMTVAAYFEDCKSAEGRWSDGRTEQNFIKTMEDIRRHMISQGFKVNRVYFSYTPKSKKYWYRDGTPVPQDVKGAIILDEKTAAEKLVHCINEGQLIVGHRGHGKPDGWEQPRLKIDDLKSISSNCTCIFFSINCLTGRFQFDPPDSNFAEQLLTINGGAPSLIAANEVSGRWRNDSMVKALFDALWPGIIPKIPKTDPSYPVKYHRLGDILNYSRAYILVKHGANVYTKKHFEIYHLIGDPTLQIWGNEPGVPELKADIIGPDLYIRMSTCPRDAVLTIWFDDVLIKRIEPTSQRLVIPLMGLDKLPLETLNSGKVKPPPLSICFSAPGCRFLNVTAGNT